MSLEFEWDEDKAHSNTKKHRVSFEGAEPVYIDPLSITVYDDVHSVEEDRMWELVNPIKVGCLW